MNISECIQALRPSTAFVAVPRELADTAHAILHAKAMGCLQHVRPFNPPRMHWAPEPEKEYTLLQGRLSTMSTDDPQAAICSILGGEKIPFTLITHMRVDNPNIFFGRWRGPETYKIAEVNQHAQEFVSVGRARQLIHEAMTGYARPHHPYHQRFLADGHREFQIYDESWDDQVRYFKRNELTKIVNPQRAADIAAEKFWNF